MNKKVDKTPRLDPKRPSHSKDIPPTPESEMLTSKWSQEKIKQVLGEEMFKEDSGKSSDS